MAHKIVIVYSLRVYKQFIQTFDGSSKASPEVTLLCKQTHVCWYDKSSGKMQFREYSEQQKLEILEEKDQISTQLIDHWLVKQLSKLMEYWTCQKITYWWNNCPNSVNWNCKIWHQCCTISMLQLNIKSGRITSYNKRHWIWIYQNQWDVQISDSSVWKERKKLNSNHYKNWRGEDCEVF